jgi:hypothetical protein
MAENPQKQALEELKKRGIVVSSESVLEEDGTGFEEFKKGAESLLKGSAKGLVDLVGGWGTLYDYLSKSKDPSALSSSGILKGIRDLGGPDFLKIAGYKGLYEAGQAGAPAAAATAVGLPGLFSRTPLGVAGEFGVAGATSVGAQQVAPDSPLAQFLLQSSPYALKGGVMSAREALTKPSGAIPPSLDELLRVGRMTPGQATGSRTQLRTEARVASEASIGEKAADFNIGQAKDVQSFLGAVFDRASSSAVSPTEATTSAFNAFQNYGKALSGNLRKQAAKDFGEAKATGGKIDTTPVVDIIKARLSELPPETPGLESLRASLNRILDEYTIPAKEAIITPSTILGPTGQPATVSITPAVPAGLREISIDRLQKNLSAWGEAAYSGKADFGKGNIFEGVAPGQAKGVALSVLRGFREALDNASLEGVAGADKLIKARDNFKANLAKIEDYSNIPLTKYFDVETVSALTPEKVMDKLASVKPTERVFLAQVLQNSPDGSAVFDTVRRNEFNKLLQKASTEAAEGSPEFVLQTALTELGKKKSDFDFLFTNQTDKADALLAMAYMKKVLKDEAPSGKGGISGGEAYATARAFGGSSQVANAVKEIAGHVRDLVASPSAFADVIFNPDTVKKMAEAQKTPTIKKLTDLSVRLGDATAKFAPRVGPMVETTQPTDTSEPIETTPQITPEAALQQLRLMGIEVEE